MVGWGCVDGRVEVWVGCGRVGVGVGWWVRVVGEVGSEWKAGKGVGVRCWLGRDGCVVSVMGGG